MSSRFGPSEGVYTDFPSCIEVSESGKIWGIQAYDEQGTPHKDFWGLMEAFELLGEDGWGTLDESVYDCWRLMSLDLVQHVVNAHKLAVTEGSDTSNERLSQSIIPGILDDLADCEEVDSRVEFKGTSGCFRAERDSFTKWDPPEARRGLYTLKASTQRKVPTNENPDGDLFYFDWELRGEDKPGESWTVALRWSYAPLSNDCLPNVYEHAWTQVVVNHTMLVPTVKALVAAQEEFVLAACKGIDTWISSTPYPGVKPFE